MSMFSVMILMFLMIAAAALIAGLYVAVRVYGARRVEGDHPQG